MEQKYYVNRQAQRNGDHEVHTPQCNYMPQLTNAVYLGEHRTCTTAVTEAKKHFRQVNGCKYCCAPCHTQ